MPPQRKVTKNSLSSWSIERKHSFGEFVGGWLEERRKVGKSLCTLNIVSSYRVACVQTSPFHRKNRFFLSEGGPLYTGY